jgi:hypothetical protein
MVVALVPLPFLLMFVNHDSASSGVIPIVVVGVVAVSYSWLKWQRRPEDTQSVAFMGLDRRTRWSTYRSIWRGRSIDDPVVLTMVETMHEHLRQRSALVVATLVAIAVATVALVELGGDGLHAGWITLTMVVLAASVGGLRWVMRRGALVVGRSQAAEA